MHVFLFRIIFLFVCFSCVADDVPAQADTAVADTTRILPAVADSPGTDTGRAKKKYEGIQFLRIGTDLKSFAFPFMYPGKSFYEISIDYKYRDKLYPVLEAGWGKGRYDYPHLSYHADTRYLKLGIDNSILGLRHKRDFDIAFVGFRYGMGFGKRSRATYRFASPFGGEFTGAYEPENFFVHWGEITAGMKLEIFPRVYIGWTGRARFLLNKSTFRTVSPFFIAGYGNADKATAFDAGLYIHFTIFNVKSS